MCSEKKKHDFFYLDYICVDIFYDKSGKPTYFALLLFMILMYLYRDFKIFWTIFFFFFFFSNYDF